MHIELCARDNHTLLLFSPVLPGRGLWGKPKAAISKAGKAGETCTSNAATTEEGVEVTEAKEIERTR